MQTLHDLVRMSALSVGMHHNHTTLLDGPLQMVFDPDRRDRRVGIAGHDIPKNEPETESTGYVNRVVIELSIRRAKQSRVMTVLSLEQTNGSKDFLFLPVR